MPYRPMNRAMALREEIRAASGGVEGAEEKGGRKGRVWCSRRWRMCVRVREVSEGWVRWMREG